MIGMGCSCLIGSDIFQVTNIGGFSNFKPPHMANCTEANIDENAVIEAPPSTRYLYVGRTLQVKETCHLSRGRMWRGYQFER